MNIWIANFFWNCKSCKFVVILSKQVNHVRLLIELQFASNTYILTEKHVIRYNINNAQIFYKNKL